MRKQKILAAAMILTLVGSIGTPVQAAGYCINGSSGNCQIVIGGNCNNSNGGNCLNSNNDCSNANNSCANVKGENDSQTGNKNNCGQSGNTCKIVIGNSCSNSQTGDVKSADDINEFIKKNLPSCQSNSTPNSCAPKSVQKYIAGNESCAPSVIQRSTVQSGNACPSGRMEGNTEQATTQGKTTEQATTRRQTTEQATTRRQTTEQATTRRQTTEQATTRRQTTEQQTTERYTKPEQTTTDQTTVADRVLDLVNQNRADAGLHTLKLDQSLCAAAQIRASEIVKSFSHTRPDGRKFSTVLTDNGIRFTAAGENIAWGQTSPEQVMNGWMNSDGHRANIMNSTYTKLGVGHVTVNGRQYWVQLFSY